MSVSLAGFVLAAIAAPHALRLDASSPLTAAAIWLAALALRALAAVSGALLLLLYLPTTAVFKFVAHWCWHGVIPFVAAHLPLSGHTFADAALIFPAALLVASALSVAAGLWLATRRVGKLLQRAVVGPGPQASLVLADGDVLVASAGLRHPRVVVSAGALLCFDDEELAASLEHERGHIARRHRYFLVAAEFCRAFARFLPGTRAAVRELVFHVERDADRYAVVRDHDPIVLASAICKAATAKPLGSTAPGLSGGIVARRIKVLLNAESPLSSRCGSALRVLAAAMATLVLFGATTLPASAHAGYHAAGTTQLVRHCSA